MAIEKPVKVKGASIVSNQVVSFSSGLDERGEYNASPDSYTYGRNVTVNSSNNATKRLGKKKWLPDTVGFNSEVSTVYYNYQIYYFVAELTLSPLRQAPLPRLCVPITGSSV